MKFIFSFILLMLFYCINGNVMMSSEPVTDNAFSLCKFSSSSFLPLEENTSSSFDKFQSLSISDGEIAIKTTSEVYSNQYRLRRIIEANDLLKDVMYKSILLRENSLVLDQSKFYYSDQNPYYSVICSDYYVYTLRRILI